MHCDGLISAQTSTLPLPKHPCLSSSNSGRVSLSTRTRFVSLKARSSINEASVKPISEMSFYELLGIPETVSLSDIKLAYKQLARKYHPDVSPPERVMEYTERFIRVQEAYETLSDPRSRAMYDRDMARGLHLVFSARKKNTSQFDQEVEEVEDKSEWKLRWQGQLSGLKKRSMYKDPNASMSWGDRMRMQRDDSSST